MNIIVYVVVLILFLLFDDLGLYLAFSNIAAYSLFELSHTFKYTEPNYDRVFLFTSLLLIPEFVVLFNHRFLINAWLFVKLGFFVVVCTFSQHKKVKNIYLGLAFWFICLPTFLIINTYYLNPEFTVLMLGSNFLTSVGVEIQIEKRFRLLYRYSIPLLSALLGWCFSNYPLHWTKYFITSVFCSSTTVLGFFIGDFVKKSHNQKTFGNVSIGKGFLDFFTGTFFTGLFAYFMFCLF